MLNIKRDTLLPRYKLATSYKIKVRQALYLRWEDFKNHILLLKQSSFDCVTHWNSSHQTAKENKSKKKRGGLPWQSSVKTMLPLQGVQIRSLVRILLTREQKRKTRVNLELKGFFLSHSPVWHFQQFVSTGLASLEVTSLKIMELEM